jgi:ATP-dependent phosphoenolpyruvate carboxykinase
MKDFTIRLSVSAPSHMSEYEVENDIYEAMRYNSVLEDINVDDCRETPEY